MEALIGRKVRMEHKRYPGITDVKVCAIDGHMVRLEYERVDVGRSLAHIWINTMSSDFLSFKE